MLVADTLREKRKRTVSLCKKAVFKEQAKSIEAKYLKGLRIAKIKIYIPN